MNSSKSKSLVASGYSVLVKNIQAELTDLDFFIKRRTAESYWKVGKFIHEHLLENKDRAEYGATLFEKLAKDIDRDATTLSRAVRFYRTYPILVPGQELGWVHYRKLITVKDEKERKKLEAQIIQKKWDGRKLQQYLNTKRELKAEEDGGKPIPQLKFTRGKMGICQVIKKEGAPHLPTGRQVLLDLGFRMRRAITPAQSSRFKDGDSVLVSTKDGEWSFQKTDVEKDALYTYKAEVGKIIDGDTLWVTINAGFDIFIEQKLRLRGIDCPEIDTDEGKQAKKFVESHLKGLEFIVIKTHKDSVDKYDRYLADIFYGEGQDFLNQDLLNERLAVVY